ncbi:hypothetical protein QFC19_003889 [Naganishia cerealis]|uniref:Uncharacterized protein n=1 Tax=Naganishia cerealis TaxID=610337 RepID=A0ACC2W043_9TREE|nr:hypothetical protein QFC19_003889 [Naganishia cerealis]
MRLDTDFPLQTLSSEPVNEPYPARDDTEKPGRKASNWLRPEEDVVIKRRGSVQEGNDPALWSLATNQATLHYVAEEAGVSEEQESSTADGEPSLEYLDGGFGWAIVASTFVITFHFLGYLYSWGVIQADLLGKGLASSQLLSVVGGLQAFWNAAGCIPAELLIRRIGVRKTTLLGVILNSLAVLLASFSTKSLGGLIFLQGIVAGIACAILFMSSIVAQIVGSHRVNQAIGAIELVSSIGFLAGPISGGALLDAFGGPEAGAEAYKPAMYLVGGTTFAQDKESLSTSIATNDTRGGTTVSSGTGPEPSCNTPGTGDPDDISLPGRSSHDGGTPAIRSDAQRGIKIEDYAEVKIDRQVRHDIIIVRLRDVGESLEVEMKLPLDTAQNETAGIGLITNWWKMMCLSKGMSDQGRSYYRQEVIALLDKEEQAKEAIGSNSASTSSTGTVAVECQTTMTSLTDQAFVLASFIVVFCKRGARRLSSENIFSFVALSHGGALWVKATSLTVEKKNTMTSV